MKRLLVVLVAAWLALGGLIGNDAQAAALPAFEGLASVSFIQEGSERYPVIGGLLIKRPANEVFGYYDTSTHAWHIWICAPGDMEIGLVFSADKCPDSGPAVLDDSNWTIGSSPVDYGDNLKGFAYSLPADQHINSGFIFSGNHIVELYINILHTTHRPELGSCLADSAVYIPETTDTPGGMVTLYQGIGWTAKDAITIESYGSDRYVVRKERYKSDDINIHVFFDEDQYGKRLFYTAQDYDREFLRMDTADVRHNTYAYNADSGTQASDEVIGYGGVITIRCPENEVMTLRLMGAEEKTRYISFIINPKGDFAFPPLGDASLDDTVDIKHQTAFVKLSGLIQGAKSEQQLTFDATDLDYLPYYVADELHAKAKESITLTVKYKEEGEVKTIDLPSAQAVPAAVNRIYYPTTEVGLRAIIGGAVPTR